MRYPKIAEKDMNFRVSNVFHKDFKVVATYQDMEMRQLLEVAFVEYVENHKAELRGLNPAAFSLVPKR